MAPLAKAVAIVPCAAKITGLSADVWEKKVRPHLQYKDAAIKALLDRHRKSYEWKRMNPQTWETRRADLENKLVIPLYEKREIATTNANDSITEFEILCRPGSLHSLSRDFVSVESRIKYPDAHLDFAFQTPPKHSLYPYQEASVTNLLQARHGNVEIATGGGKTLIALHLIARAGLRAAVIVPGKENFLSMMREFREAFGEERVGVFGNGQKIIGRDITVCIGKSLSLLNRQQHADEWEFFSKEIQLILVDESHTWGAASMAAVCHCLFAKVPYRLFLSATQERGILEAPLLKSIIGPRVHELTTADAVRSEYIAPHQYEIYSDVPCPDGIDVSNPLTLRRQAFLHNEAIARLVAVRCLGDLIACKPSLILVDEVGQIGLLVRCMREEQPDLDLESTIAFAHGETNAKRLTALELPKNTAKSMEAAIMDMNTGRKMLMIATGCIQTGTSLYTIHTTYNCVGGGATNRIKTSQGAVGRSVRKWESNPYINEIPSHVQPKTSTVIVDFDVDEPQMRKHLAKRITYYELSETPIKYIRSCSSSRTSDAPRGAIF